MCAIAILSFFEILQSKKYSWTRARARHRRLICSRADSSRQRSCCCCPQRGGFLPSPSVQAPSCVAAPLFAERPQPLQCQRQPWRLLQTAQRRPSSPRWRGQEQTRPTTSSSPPAEGAKSGRGWWSFSGETCRTPGRR